ncbi:unnamed protein product [Caretta caretta]
MPVHLGALCKAAGFTPDFPTVPGDSEGKWLQCNRHRIFHSQTCCDLPGKRHGSKISRTLRKGRSRETATQVMGW